MKFIKQFNFIMKLINYKKHYHGITVGFTVFTTVPTGTGN